MKRSCLAIVAIASILLTAPALAQQDQRGPRPLGGQLRSDMVARDYFNARFVLSNAEAIALSEEQRGLIAAEARDAASEFGGLLFDLDTELRRMSGLSSLNPVDEEAVVAQLEAVLELERRIKVLQLRTAVRIRNALSVEQQEKLLEIRRDTRTRDPRQPR